MNNSLSNRRLYDWLRRNWNALVATISVVGYFAGYQLGLLEGRQEFFAFLGANAAIWTLIEIKNSLDERLPARRYADMRAAREAIIGSVKRTLARKRETTVTIVGGRIRTISDLLRELVGGIETGKIPGINTRFVIYCLDANFLNESVATLAVTNQEELAIRFKSQAIMVDQLASEIRAFNHKPVLMNRNIRFEVIQYRSAPTFYAFVVDQEEVFWGFFSWNAESMDFEGPANPCFCLTGQDDTRDDYRTWILNQSKFFELTASRSSRKQKESESREP